MSKTSLEELREKSLKLTGYLEFLIDFYLAKTEGNQRRVTCEIITPRDPEQRGCQLSLKFNCDISRIYQQLVKRGVVVSASSSCAWTHAIARSQPVHLQVDERYPYVIRVAPVHLYNSFKDVWRFVQQLMASIKAVEEEEAAN